MEIKRLGYCRGEIVNVVNPEGLNMIKLSWSNRNDLFDNYMGVKL